MKELLISGVLVLMLLIFYASRPIHSEVDSSTKFTEEINKLASIKETVISCAQGSNNPVFTDSLEEILINDNRQPAGELLNGILYLSLEARTGIWYPETHDGTGLRVHAFAEAGKPLQLPGPLIRVPQGTEIRVKVHNSIEGTSLVLRGFYSRPGNPNDSVAIAYGQTYEVQFKTGAAGTYLYWASAGNLKEDAGLPYFNDSQLYGAFIIDSINKKTDPQERIMMIGIWNDTLNGPANNGEELVMNGLTWPYTERLTYLIDQDVHWRVINASNQAHPMHLHGFYYTVNSRGNADRDMIYEEQYRRRSVTELVQPHETMSMTWTPEKEGNWLFHCHTLVVS
jgi:FtsP/CotA-like multicopper oxidase with cupredoxin domain